MTPLPLLLLLLLSISTISYLPSLSLPSSGPKPTKGILIIDGFSPFHSAYLSDLTVHEYGSGIVNALSPYTAQGLQRTSPPGESEDFMAYVPPLSGTAELSRWLDAIPFDLVGIFCESDSGLDFSELLSSAISSLPRGSKLLHNGHLPARRDKYLLNEHLSTSGIPTVRQTLCTSPSSILSTFPLYPPPVILKPPLGCASENVFLCPTPQSAELASSTIFNSNQWGTYNTPTPTVLLQAYIPGPEFAVDCVSHLGSHKEVAIWSYDKTDAGLGPFAYRGTSLYCPSTDPPLFEKICHYVFECLTSLGVEEGLTHSEVRITEEGEPLVVEVNCRQHNANVLPLTTMCVGYNAVSLLACAYLCPGSEFDSYPDVQGTLLSHGMIMHLQCPRSGVVRSLDVSRIEGLPTVVEMEVYEDFQPGSEVSQTQDIRGDAGWVVLVGDEEEVKGDYREACEIMKTMFEFEET